MKNKNILILALLGIIFFIISIVGFYNKELNFYLQGNSIVEINIDSEYKEDGYKAKYCNKYIKFLCTDLSNKVYITKHYNKDDKNIYYLNYIFKYDNYNKVLTRTIISKDMTSPTISLTTNNVVCPNKNYIVDDYSAYDNVDGDITDKVIKEIKNNKIYYSVTDSSGNKRIIFRDILYSDSEKPTIELVDGSTNYIYLNTNYIDKGYSAIDNCDGDITSNVTIESNVDITKIGNYEIKYYVSDSSGNKTTAVRNIVVYDDIGTTNKNGKIVYLTFDDGPASYTEEIINILDKYNIKATFFVTNQFSEYQQLIKKAYDSGHSIGIHTLTHNFEIIYSSVEEYMNDFNNMNQIIYEQTGVYSKIFRFPGGSSNTISRFNKGIMTELSKLLLENNYSYYDWNVDSKDTQTNDPEQIYNNVIQEIEKKDISMVLLHDIKKANIISIEKIISYGLEKGYTFLPIDSTTPIIRHSINN